MDQKELEKYFAAKLEAEWGPHDLKKRLDSHDPSVVVLDTRKADAFQQEHIPGALNIHTDELDSRWDCVPCGGGGRLLPSAYPPLHDRSSIYSMYNNLLGLHPFALNTLTSAAAAAAISTSASGCFTPTGSSSSVYCSSGSDETISPPGGTSEHYPLYPYGVYGGTAGHRYHPYRQFASLSNPLSKRIDSTPSLLH